MFPYRLKHHDVRVFAILCRSANSFVLVRNHQLVITRRVDTGISIGRIGAIMKTFSSILFHHLQLDIIFNGTLLLNEIDRSPQECPDIFSSFHSGRHSIGGFEVLGPSVPPTAAPLELLAPPMTGMLAKEPGTRESSQSGISS
jgi:hypothetical protein